MTEPAIEEYQKLKLAGDSELRAWIYLVGRQQELLAECVALD